MRALVGGLGALLLVGTLLPADAEAQRGRTAERIENLEEQLRDLQGAVYGEDASGAPVRFQGANPNGVAADPADLSVRIGTIEEELQRLTGEMERLNFKMRQQEEAMRRLISIAYPEYEGDIGLGLETPSDEGLAGPSGAPVDLVGGGDTPSTSASGLPVFRDAESAYAAGRSALLEARYEDAERAFLAVDEQFPNSDRAGDATYYLGETYLAQGDLGAAARTFLNFIREHPDHPRAAEAHLKLGQAFARADKTREACRVWQRGLQTYDDMDDQLRRRMSDMREATCTS